MKIFEATQFKELLMAFIFNNNNIHNNNNSNNINNNNDDNNNNNKYKTVQHLVLGCEKLT